MVKIIFTGTDMAALKLEIQEYALLHLGLKLEPPKIRLPIAPIVGPTGEVIKRGPGRPKKSSIDEAILANPLESEQINEDV